MRSALLGATSLITLVGCTSDEDSGAGDLGPMITGEIQPDGEDIRGTFEGYRAFAFDSAGIFMAYISPNVNATCDNVTDYLQTDAAPYDPVDVLTAERCDMFIKVDGDWDGGISHSWNDSSEGIDTIGPGTSIGCAMGEGEWRYERRDNDDKDYYYSGRWWQGHPTTYSYDFAGDGDSGYTLDIQMSAYGGGFIYEDFSNDPASGAVTGLVSADVCSSLAQTGLFN